jgi:hypothetical protein
MRDELHEHLSLELFDNGCSLLIEDFIITLYLFWSLLTSLVLLDQLS